jgi:hypothetical protein
MYPEHIHDPTAGAFPDDALIQNRDQGIGPARFARHSRQGPRRDSSHRPPQCIDGAKPIRIQLPFDNSMRRNRLYVFVTESGYHIRTEMYVVFANLVELIY